MSDWKTPSLQLQLSLSQSSGATLFLLLWEWGITFDDEVNLIWSKSNRSWLKWVFLFVRYFILFVQLCGRGMEMAVSYQYDLNDSMLRGWYSSQVIPAALAVCCLEAVLMARVYALYKQKRWVGIFLLSLLFVEIAVAVTGMVLTFPGKNFNAGAVIASLPRSFAYFGISSVLVQTIILVLTLAKYTRSSIKAVPLAGLMMRDGTLAFLALAITGATIVVYTLCSFIPAATVYAWYLTAVSCSACRLIINMQYMAVPVDSRDASTSIRLTTIFSDQIAYEDVSPQVDHEIEMIPAESAERTCATQSA